VSRYLVDKFLYRVDRSEADLNAYMSDPAGFVARWEETEGPRLDEVERTSGHRFTEYERAALKARDYEKLYAMGAHPFILWTIMLPVYLPGAAGFQQLAQEYKDRIRPYGRPDFAT
jgi:hypothetical protein